MRGAKGMGWDLVAWEPTSPCVSYLRSKTMCSGIQSLRAVPRGYLGVNSDSLFSRTAWARLSYPSVSSSVGWDEKATSLRELLPRLNTYGEFKVSSDYRVRFGFRGRDLPYVSEHGILRNLHCGFSRRCYGGGMDKQRVTSSETLKTRLPGERDQNQPQNVCNVRCKYH